MHTLESCTHGCVLKGPCQLPMHLLEERPCLFCFDRINQHDLDNEIELPQWCGRLLRLHNVVFQQKRDVVHQLQRHFTVDAQDGAIDVDPLASPERKVHATSHLR